MKKTDQMKKGLQKFLQFNDEEISDFMKNQRNLDMLEKSSVFMNTIFEFNVLESSGCVVGHKAGQKVVLDGTGALITSENPERICIHLLNPLASMVMAAQELMYQDIDPNEMKFKTCGCFDVGLKCGGIGHVAVNFTAIRKAS